MHSYKQSTIHSNGLWARSGSFRIAIFIALAPVSTAEPIIVDRISYCGADIASQTLALAPLLSRYSNCTRNNSGGPKYIFRVWPSLANITLPLGPDLHSPWFILRLRFVRPLCCDTQMSKSFIIDLDASRSQYRSALFYSRTLEFVTCSSTAQWEKVNGFEPLK